jgi:hypothetical protein
MLTILNRILKFLADNWFNPVTVDSTVPLNVAVNGTVDIDDAVPIDINVTNPVTVDDSTPIDVNVTSPITATLKLPLDAAGSLRTSNKNITGIYTQRHILDPAIERVTSNATIVHSPDYAAAEMTVTAAGGYAICKTYQNHPYIVGKSTLYEMTSINMQIETGVVKRLGAWLSNKVAPFDSNKIGFYFEADGSVVNDYKVVITNDTVVTASIPRAQWFDKLDGTGPSGKTVNFENFTIFRTDFLWLGGKGLLMEVCIDNEFIPFVSYAHSNNVKNLIFKTPMLPIRAEIRAAANFTVPRTMYFTCATHAIEGIVDLRGRTGTVRTPLTTPITMALANTKYLAVAFRQADLYDDAIIDFLDASLVITGNDDMGIEWILNPTIASAGSLVWALAPNTDNLQFAHGLAANVVTGGIPLFGTIQRQATSIISIVDNLRRIGKQLNGTSEVIALVLTPASTAATAFATVNYFEL